MVISINSIKTLGREKQNFEVMWLMSLPPHMTWGRGKGISVMGQCKSELRQCQKVAQSWHWIWWEIGTWQCNDPDCLISYLLGLLKRWFKNARELHQIFIRTSSFFISVGPAQMDLFWINNTWWPKESFQEIFAPGLSSTHHEKGDPSAKKRKKERGRRNKEWPSERPLILWGKHNHSNF